MDRRLNVREWNATNLDAAELTDVQGTIARLKGELRPTLPQMTVSGQQVTIQNLIGSARMPSGNVLQVEPKIVMDFNWAAAAVQLLEPSTRIAVTGSQRSKPSASKNSLSSAVALEYARRLERALRQEGPIQVLERQHHKSLRLNGQLNVTRWLRSSTLSPTVFPLDRDEHTVANDFSKALSLVSGLFHRSAREHELSSRLRVLETAVIPGHPLPSYVNPAVTMQKMPPQWAKYAPAWDIAVAVLRNHSVVGDPGRANGLEVAVEPWQLLETLLERTLRAFATEWEHQGYAFEPKKSWPLLTSQSEAIAQVEPDGLLLRDGKTVATFEAKYSRLSTTPAREHTFQALSTAAALNSPLAVLVYPGDETPRFFDVEGFHGTPARLVTVGLSMFAYSRSGGDGLRAGTIRKLLEQR